MLPTLSPWGTIAYFKINRDYIAKVLCKNRQRPELKCDGKCYLAKKLKEQEDKNDKETSERVHNTPMIQLFAASVTSYIFGAPAIIGSLRQNFFYLVHLYSAPAAKLLRPPKR
jgi:hypothetical protein